MRIGAALCETHDAETELAYRLLEVGERHKGEHDLFHMARTLRGWSDRHVVLLAEHAPRFAVDLDGDAAAEGDGGGGPLDRIREKTAEVLGRRPEPGLLLLRDLRELHLSAARTSFAWTILGQGAQAIKDTELLSVVSECHPEAIRTMKWTVQKVKEVSPQVLAG